VRLPAGDVSGRASDRGRGRPISLSLINHLLQSYGYFAVFAFIALESLGIPMPGETTLIAAAVYASSTGHLNIGIIFLVAAAAAIVGDNAGYWLGRSGGQRLASRYGRFVRRDVTKLKIGQYLFGRHGGTVK
jgi:membrane protein DedA with SNARE-associated domain